MVKTKRVLALVGFLAGLLGILVGLSTLFVPKNNMSEFGMEEVTANGILGERENSIDVLVLGDSEAYSSITPMDLWRDKGYTAYVCGTSSQTLDYTLELFIRALENQKPKVVILETDAIYREVPSQKAIFTRLANHLAVFRYHNRWKTLSWNDFLGETHFTWTDDWKGYRYYATISGTNPGEYMKPVETAAEIPERNIRYVKEIQRLCQENGARLVFLSAPSPVNWNYARHNGIQALAQEMGCEYLDLNLKQDQIPIDWSKDTRDKGDHLNHFGAVKVTHYLAGWLEETGLLTDHRNDENYAKWNDALKKYEAVVEKG